MTGSMAGGHSGGGPASRDVPGPLIGAHMSVAGGVAEAFARGEASGCATMQIFTRNASRWEAPPLAGEEIARFEAERARTGIAPVFSHDSYLINLASPDRSLLARSRRTFLDELRRAAALGLPFVVAHPGAHMGGGVESGIRRVAESIDWLEGRTGGRGPRICLENTAGAGTVLAGDFAHLAGILARVRLPQRVGVCLDTCHAHAAGYDLGDAEGWGRTLDALEAAVGPGRLLALHLNDARGERGSRLDRHEHVGRGRLGLECFRVAMNEPRLAAVPKVIETPKERAGVAMDPVNLGLLRGLAGRARVPARLARLVGGP